MAKETGTMDQLKKTNLWLMCFFFAFTKWSSVNHSSFDLKKNKNYPKISFSLRCTTLFMVLAIIIYLWNNRPNRTKKLNALFCPYVMFEKIQNLCFEFSGNSICQYLRNVLFVENEKKK